MANDSKEKYSKAVIDISSGEIIDYATENETYRKVNIDNIDRQREYYKNNKKNFLHESSFVKTFDVAERYIRYHLTEAEYRLAVMVSHYGGYNDGILRKFNKFDSRTLTLNDIADIYGHNYDHVRKIVKRLIDKQIMGKLKYKDFYPDYEGKNKTVYFMNPYIFFRGTDVRRILLEQFNNTFWQKLHDDFNEKGIINLELSLTDF